LTKIRGRRKTRVGVVVSDKMNETCVVQIERRGAHPVYKKVIRHFKKFMVHDQANHCKVGDIIRIMECRPLSKKKRWRYIETVQSSKIID